MDRFQVPNQHMTVREWKVWLHEPLKALYLRDYERWGFPRSACYSAESMALEFYFRLGHFQECFHMAQKSKKESWQTDWVHVELTPDQKGEFRAWDMEDEDVMELLGGFLSAGYKLTCNYNQTNSTYQASLICTGQKDTNSGKGVSGYAAQLRDAIRVAVYKISVILPEDWGDYTPPGGSDIG